MRLLIRDNLQLRWYDNMRIKTTIAAAAAFIIAMIASMMFVTTHAESSIRVTQSTEDGLEVECEGNLKCEIIGDDTVVATSEDNNTTTTVTTTTGTTTLNQSNIIQFGDDFDVIEEQDLGARIEGMVDRLLDEIFS
jgi:hypothetical protein